MAVQINLESYAKPWRPGIYPKSTTVIYNNQLWILNNTITGLFSSSDFLAEVANGDWIGRYTTEADLSTKEDIINKATDFSVINDTLYPSIEAVKEQLDLKLDKVSTVDVEKVYIKNADGTQGVKATSAFKDVLEYANLAAFPVTGETGKIYLALNTNKTYRWSGSAYVQLSAGIDFPSDGKTYGVKDGLPIEILDELYRSWFSYMPNNAGSWLVVNTGNPLSVSGTSTVVPRSGTSIYGSIIMNNCVSATPNGSNSGIKNNNSSDGVYREGVDAYFVWANNDSNNQCCTAVGLYSLLLAVPNLNPSNFTASTVIVGSDVGDTNLSFIVNRTAATASFLKIDCGSGFPANSTTDAYLLRIHINKTEVQADRYAKVILYNLVTGAVASRVFTGAQLPDSNANFAVMINRGNRNTGAATNIRPSKIHVTRKIF